MPHSSMIVTVRTGRHKDKIRRHVEMTMKILMRNVVAKVEEENINEIRGLLDDMVTDVVNQHYRQEAGEGIQYYADILEKSLLEDNGLEYVYIPPLPPPAPKMKKKSTLLSLGGWKKTQDSRSYQNQQSGDNSFREGGVEYQYVTIPEDQSNEWDSFVNKKPENDEEKLKEARMKRAARKSRSTISPASILVNKSLESIQRGNGGRASSLMSSKRRSTNWGFNVSFQTSHLLHTSHSSHTAAARGVSGGGGMISRVSKHASSLNLEDYSSDEDTDYDSADASDSEQDKEEQYEDETDEEYDLRMFHLREKLKRKRRRRRRKLRKIKSLVFKPGAYVNPTPGWWTIEKDLIMLQSGVRAVVTRIKVRRTVAALNPPLYEKYFDLESGNQYYVCTTSGRVTWDRPKLLFLKPERTAEELIVYVQTEARKHIAKRRAGNIAAQVYVRILLSNPNVEKESTSRQGSRNKHRRKSSLNGRRNSKTHKKSTSRPNSALLRSGSESENQILLPNQSNFDDLTQGEQIASHGTSLKEKVKSSNSAQTSRRSSLVGTSILEEAEESSTLPPLNNNNVVENVKNKVEKEGMEQADQLEGNLNTITSKELNDDPRLTPPRRMSSATTAEITKAATEVVGCCNGLHTSSSSSSSSSFNASFKYQDEDKETKSREKRSDFIAKQLENSSGAVGTAALVRRNSSFKKKVKSSTDTREGEALSKSNSSTSLSFNRGSIRNMETNQISEESTNKASPIKEAINSEGGEETTSLPLEYFYYNTRTGASFALLPTLLYHRTSEDLRTVTQDEVYKFSNLTSAPASAKLSLFKHAQSYRFDQDEEGDKEVGSSSDGADSSSELKGQHNSHHHHHHDEGSEGSEEDITSKSVKKRQSRIKSNTSFYKRHPDDIRSGAESGDFESYVIGSALANSPSENSMVGTSKTSSPGSSGVSSIRNSKDIDNSFNGDNNSSSSFLIGSGNFNGGVYDGGSGGNAMAVKDSLKKRSNQVHPKHKLLKKKSSKREKEQLKAEWDVYYATKIQATYRGWVCQRNTGKIMMKKKLYKREFDQDYKRHYFVHVPTDRSSWNKPRVLYSLPEEIFLPPKTMFSHFMGKSSNSSSHSPSPSSGMFKASSPALASGLGRAAAKALLSSKMTSLLTSNSHLYDEEEDEEDDGKVRIVLRSIDFEKESPSSFRFAAASKRESEMSIFSETETENENEDSEEDEHEDDDDDDHAGMKMHEEEDHEVESNSSGHSDDEIDHEHDEETHEINHEDDEEIHEIDHEVDHEHDEEIHEIDHEINHEHDEEIHETDHEINHEHDEEIHETDHEINHEHDEEIHEIDHEINHEHDEEIHEEHASNKASVQSKAAEEVATDDEEGEKEHSARSE